MDRRKLKILRNHRAAMAGLGLVTLFVLLSLVVGIVSPYDPEIWIPGEELQGISTSHWLGTDSSGRDILTRVVWGIQTRHLLVKHASGSLFLGP